MERDGGGDWHADQFDTPPPFPPDGSYNNHHHNFTDEHNDFGTNGGNSDHLSAQNRQFPPQPYFPEYGYVKLYVVGIPRTATEQDIGEYFGVYGELIEVVLLKDKWTGFQQECCFVKYATIEQAEGAILALNGLPFAEGMNPLQVKYAVGERERLGSSGPHFHKLYVGCLSKQTLKWEVEDVFAPFGVIEAIFMPRDDYGQGRGCAFVQFSCREMAMAAIQALHGIYVMKGCEQPLVVRFADPKKPRMGDSRHAPHPGDPSGGHNMYNEMQQMKSSPPGWRAPITPSFDAAAQPAPAIRPPVNYAQPAPAIRPPVNYAQPAPAIRPPVNYAQPAPAIRPPVNYIAENEYPIECEWSEHISPDGDLYYYNCVTCESRWEMPEEYALYERQLDNLEVQQESEPEVLSSPEPDIRSARVLAEAMIL